MSEEFKPGDIVRINPNAKIHPGFHNKLVRIISRSGMTMYPWSIEILEPIYVGNTSYDIGETFAANDAHFAHVTINKHCKGLLVR